MSSSSYSHIPTEEKDGLHEVVAPIERRHKLNPKILTVSICALVLVIIGVVFSLFRHGDAESTGHAKIPVNFGEKLSNEGARAITGDKYLLGVGKADITG
jgi:hypothetical protein